MEGKLPTFLSVHCVILSVQWLVLIRFLYQRDNPLTEAFCMMIRHMLTASAAFENFAAEMADLNSENLTTNYLLKGKER